MAHIEITMQAVGVEACSDCERRFERGETMQAVVGDEGEPFGWFCQTCIDDWKAHAKQ